MKYGLRYLAFGKNNTIKAMQKFFNSPQQREKFISKGFEAGTIYQILAYEN